MLLGLALGSQELGHIPFAWRLLDVLGGDGLVARALNMIHPGLALQSAGLNGPPPLQASGGAGSSRLQGPSREPKLVFNATLRLNAANSGLYEPSQRYISSEPPWPKSANASAPPHN